MNIHRLFRVLGGVLSLSLLSVSAFAQFSRREQKTPVAYRNNYQRIAASKLGNSSFELRDGTLWAWGAGGSGQLGNGTTSGTASPTQIATVTNWVQVVCSGNHTLSLRADGTLWACGNNTFGELGIGSTTNTGTFTQVGTDNKWVSVGGGDGLSVGLKSDGTLWTWGDNTYGQLGNGTTSVTGTPSPTQLGSATDWASISVGAYTVHAIKANGTLYGWGFNGNGEVGDGTNTNRTSPVQIGSSNLWTSVSSGRVFSIGLRADGTLWAWGSNAFGQVGVGSATSAFNSPQQIGSGQDWASISAGYEHAAAVKVSGTLWAWGRNQNGQLGQGATGTYNTSPIQVGSAGTWVAVSCGRGHTLGLQANGTVYSWGDNTAGQLGTGNLTAQLSPLAVRTLSNNWIQISTGNNHTLALKSDGTIWGWGANNSGQLGNGSTSAKSTPTQIGTASDWVAVSAGTSFSLGLRADGTIWSWGSNSSGQLGNSSATPTVPVQIGTNTTWKSISAGNAHSLALRNDGTMWGWGYNGNGHLGTGNTTSQSSPVQVGTNTTWVTASAGVDHSMAMRSDGTIWGTGFNGFGELGQGATGQQTSFGQTGTATNWISVSAGGGFSMGLRADGTVYAWGDNSFGGEIGQGTTTSSYNTPQTVSVSSAIAVSAKWFNSHALLANGTMKAWGLNSSGQLGIGTTGANVTSPATVTGISDAVAIGLGAGGQIFNGILKASRMQYCMTGSNGSGQLGDGSTTSKNTYGCVSSLIGPADVDTGIVLWLDGSDVDNNSTTANPANNTALSTWKDISGNGNNATVLSGQNTPVMNTAQINGKDVVKFTRSSGSLGTVYEVTGVDIRATTMPKTTIFTVYRQGTNTSTDWHGIWGDDDGSWDRFFMPRFGSDNGIVSVGPTTNYVAVTNSGVVGETKLLTAVYDNGTANGSAIYFNGAVVQTVTDNTNTTAAKTDLRIGWDGDDNPFNGDIAEMVVYKRKLSECEIIAVNRYFKYKYGVTFSTTTIDKDTAYFCTGGGVTLTGSSSRSGVTYQWMRGGAAIGSATSSTYVAAIAGNYQLIATAGGCSDTSDVTVVKQVYNPIYVDGSVVSSGTGATWGTAVKTVSEALEMANNTSCALQIWVKAGTYYPTTKNGAATTSRDSSFRILRNNIKVYGGFSGTESALTQRNITTNLTTLSGDVGILNDSTDNCYHVMTIVGNSSNNIDSNTVVDGFTITKGNANGDFNTLSVNGMLVYKGAGGGINTAGLGKRLQKLPTAGKSYRHEEWSTLGRWPLRSGAHFR